MDGTLYVVRYSTPCVAHGRHLHAIVLRLYGVALLILADVTAWYGNGSVAAVLPDGTVLQ